MHRERTNDAHSGPCGIRGSGTKATGMPDTMNATAMARVINDLDRLSRRTARIILTLDELASRTVTVESLYEKVDTSTADGLFSVTILGALAQRERDRIAERTRAGLAAARARGRHPGRPVSVTPEQYENVQMLLALGKSYREIAAGTGISASTVARIAREETPGHKTYRERAQKQSILRP